MKAYPSKIFSNERFYCKNFNLGHLMHPQRSYSCVILLDFNLSYGTRSVYFKRHSLNSSNVSPHLMIQPIFQADYLYSNLSVELF